MQNGLLLAKFIQKITPTKYAKQNLGTLNEKQVRQPSQPKKHQVRQTKQKVRQPKHQVRRKHLRSFVVMQFLLRIYALFGVLFTGQKI